MDVYLPIAGVSLNGFVLLALGGTAGFVAGVVELGGFFLTVPLLLLAGVPPAVAVAAATSQLVAVALPSALPRWRHGAFDLVFGGLLLAGGVGGAVLGGYLFALLLRAGRTASFVDLGTLLLLVAFALATLAAARRSVQRGRPPAPAWVQRLPCKLQFRRVKANASALLPLSLGTAAGLLTAMTGAGGDLILGPALAGLGLAEAPAVGTALAAVVGIAATTTMLQAIAGTVDLILTLILVIGGALGAWLGATLSTRLRATPRRIALALLALTLASGLAANLAATPMQIFVVEALR